MFKKTDSLRQTLNISSWLARTCSPVIRERSGRVGGDPGNRICPWVLNIETGLDPAFRSLPSLLACLLTSPVMTESVEVALVFWSDSDQLAGFEVSAHLFPEGPSSAPPLPFPLLSHFVVIWRTLGVDLLEPQQGASRLSTLKRVSSWVTWGPKLPVLGSLLPRVFPCLPLAIHGGQQGTTFAVQVCYQLNPNH